MKLQEARVELGGLCSGPGVVTLVDGATATWKSIRTPVEFEAPFSWPRSFDADGFVPCDWADGMHVVTIKITPAIAKIRMFAVFSPKLSNNPAGKERTRKADGQSYGSIGLTGFRCRFGTVTLMALLSSTSCLVQLQYAYDCPEELAEMTDKSRVLQRERDD